MSPQQCPTCGRFLKHAFVAALDAADRRCPRCDELLTTTMFDMAGSSNELDATSVRPPDLASRAVRFEDDVLAGWDTGADAAEIAGWRRDRAPFPTDTVVVVAGALVGGLLGAVRGPDRARSAVLGSAVGLAVTAGTQQVWRLRG